VSVDKSASSVDRVDACPPSAVLQPRATDVNEVAGIGTAIHEFCRMRLKGASEEDALLATPEALRTRCKGIDLAAALGGATVVSCESAYVLDFSETGGGVVFVGENIGRAYDETMQAKYGRIRTDFEIATTLDVEALDPDGTPVALDWKSGKKTKPANDLWQMRLQSRALAIKYDASAVRVRVVYIDDNGDLDIDKAEFDRFELDDIPGQLRGIFARVTATTDDSTVSPGAHCAYCPHLRFCRAHTAMIRSVIGLTEDDASAMVLELTPEGVGNALTKLKHIEAYAGKLKDSLKMMVEQNGGSVPADTGYEYRFTESSKTYMNQDLARGLLVLKGASPSEIAGLNRVSRFPVLKRMKEKKTNE
jgi:hypothetical protein